MVCDNSDWVRRSLDILMPFCEGKDDHKEFLIIDVIVVLSGEKGMRKVGTGMDKTGPEEKAVLSVSNACCWREVQAHGLSFLVRRLSGATTWEKLGINFQ